MKYSFLKIFAPISLSIGVFCVYFSFTFASTSVNFLDGSTLSLNWSSPATLEAGSVFFDTGALWTTSGGTLTGSMTASSGGVNTLVPGNYTLEYTNTFSGETQSISGVIQVRDTTAPSLVLNGTASGTIEASTGVYIDSGANWTDIVDGTGSVTAYSGSVNMRVPGTYTLEYRKTDSAGNNSNIVTRTVTVVDTTPPVVTLNGLSTITIEAGSSFAEQGASVNDIVDGISTIPSASSGTVNNVLPGTYTLTYQKADSYGNTGSVSRTIIVRDTIAPVVNLNGSSAQTLEASTGSYTDLGASYTDTVIGLGTIPTATSGSVNMRVPAIYPLTYSKADTSGNTGSTSRTVTVVDTTPPSIVMNGSGSQTLEAFSGTYSDSGATWTDIVDGSGVVTAYSGSVNPKLPGTYILQYRKVDAHGNTGATLSRTVTIVDTTPPVLTLSGGINMTVEASLSAFSDPGALWTDIVDGTGTVVSAYSGSVNMRVPGVYNLDYRKVDAHGNTGSISRTVTVVDTTAPSMTLSGVTPMTVAHGSIFSDPGANWTDIVDGTGSVTAYSGSVDMNRVGTYILQYRKIDAHGNTGTTLSRTVNVTDQTPPSITLNGSSTDTVYINTVYTDPGATWVDIVDGTGSVTAYSGSVNMGVLGTYILQYRKVDAAGNVSTIISRSVIVSNPPSGGGPTGGGGGGGGGSYIPPTSSSSSSSTSGGGSSPALSPSSLTGSSVTGTITSTGGVTSLTGSTRTAKKIIPKRTPIVKVTPSVLTPVIQTETKTVQKVIPTPVQKTPSESKPVVTSPQKQETVVPLKGKTLIVNERKLNIRLAPSLDAKILGYLVRGDIVTIIDEKDGWVNFQYGQIVGWSKRGFFRDSSSVVEEKTVAPTTSVDVPKSGTDVYFVNSPRLNIRVSASAEAKTERHLLGGKNVIVLQIQGKWAQIQTEDGYIGWVAFRYLTKR